MNDWLIYAAGALACLWILICVAVGMRFVVDDLRDWLRVRRFRSALEHYDGSVPRKTDESPSDTERR